MITTDPKTTIQASLIANKIIKARIDGVGPKGESGPQGIPGVKGDAGQGVPIGGLQGQVLSKNSALDYDTKWISPDVSITSPTIGQVLQHNGTVFVNKTLASAGIAAVGHTHTIAEVSTLQASLDSKLPANTAITAGTKTKITYDAKGLITGGADATTADIQDSTNKRYVTDAQLTTIGNQSGTNTGDETTTTIKSKLGITTLSGANTGDQTSVSGNAGTATALQTARTINNISFDGSANITIPNIPVTAAPGTDLTATGMTIQLTAGVALTFGDVCYIDSAGKAQLGNATDISKAPIAIMCVDASIALNATGTFLLLGVVRRDAWNWTPGGLVYVSTTGTTTNTLTQTQPATTNNVIQIVGVATHADRLLFNPQLVTVEHT